MELKINNFCCCCSVRTGCIILGVLYLALTAAAFVDLMAYLILHFKKHYSEFPEVMFLKMLYAVDEIYPVCLATIFSGFLIYGAVRVRSGHCFAVVILHALYIFLFIFAVAYNIQNVSLSRSFLGRMILLLLFIGFNFFTMLTVYSFYQNVPKLKFV